jgi:hypothetical protein
MCLSLHLAYFFSSLLCYGVFQTDGGVVTFFRGPRAQDPSNRTTVSGTIPAYQKVNRFATIATTTTRSSGTMLVLPLDPVGGPRNGSIGGIIGDIMGCWGMYGWGRYGFILLLRRKTLRSRRS